MISLAAVIAVARKEARALARDPVVVKGVILQPIILTIIFGMAVKSDIKQATWAVYDADRSALSRRLADEVEATHKVAPPERLASYADVQQLFERGGGAAAIVIPPGFSRAIERGERSPVQLLLNGAEPLVALRFSAVVSDVARRFPSAAPANAYDRTPRRAGEPALVMRRTIRFNPKLTDTWFFIPTIPAVFITQLFFGLACFSIAGERERGTYEHLIALPLRPQEILIGKALPFVAIAYAIVTAYYLVAGLAFGVTARGSWLALALVSLPFFATCYVVAALFSAIAKNTHQAIYLTVFSVLPSTVISGFLVPTSTMPKVIQWAGEALPATHYVTMLRAIIVRGASLSELGAPLASLGAIFAVTLGLVLLFFPRRLE